MTRQIILTSGFIAYLTISALADDTKVDPTPSASTSAPEAASDPKDGKGGGDFSGTITAVESSRDSITVANSDGQVKMFGVSSEQKSHLAVGQVVTVRYTDQYTWPVPTRSIKVTGN